MASKKKRNMGKWTAGRFITAILLLLGIVVGVGYKLKWWLTNVAWAGESFGIPIEALVAVFVILLIYVLYVVYKKNGKKK